MLYEPNDHYIQRMRASEADAKANHHGLWGACNDEDTSTAPMPAPSPSPSRTAETPQQHRPVGPRGEDRSRSAPIKGNQSMIYHESGGTYYDVTTPKECFASADDAERAGYRASKR